MSSNSKSCEISVVVPALNETGHLRQTVEQLRATLPESSEIIVVDDGSQDGCADFLRETSTGGVKLITQTPKDRLGAAGARNRGAREASGGILIFADAHIEVPSGWWEPLLKTLSDTSVGAVAPAISVMDRPENRGFGLRWINAGFGVEWLPPKGDETYAVPLLPGACLAIRREVFLAIGGFDEGMIRWGSEDAELSLRIWLSGYDLRLTPGVVVSHLFRREHPYTIDWASVIHNMLRVAFSHFNALRIARVVEALKNYHNFAEACALIALGDVYTRRAEWLARRTRSDDWYFSRFGDII